jgi:AraC-like DNA-binding protein
MQMLGGHFLCDPTNAALLLSLLPTVVHVQASDSGADRLAWIVKAIRDETSAQRPGGEPILVRLVEIMLIEALRWRPVGASAQLTGLLAGLADPRLSIALRLLHEAVPHRWTIADLARKAGMSRAAFAARFSRTLGMPPMDYLLRWRMALAKDLLRHDGLSLAEVADAIGYQSASAFSARRSAGAWAKPPVGSRAMAACALVGRALQRIPHAWRPAPDRGRAVSSSPSLWPAYGDGREARQEVGILSVGPIEADPGC